MTLFVDSVASNRKATVAGIRGLEALILYGDQLVADLPGGGRLADRFGTFEEALGRLADQPVPGRPGVTSAYTRKGVMMTQKLVNQSNTHVIYVDGGQLFRVTVDAWNAKDFQARQEVNGTFLAQGETHPDLEVVNKTLADLQTSMATMKGQLETTAASLKTATQERDAARVEGQTLKTQVTSLEGTVKERDATILERDGQIKTMTDQKEAEVAGLTQVAVQGLVELGHVRGSILPADRGHYLTPEGNVIEGLKLEELKTLAIEGKPQLTTQDLTPASLAGKDFKTLTGVEREAWLKADPDGYHEAVARHRRDLRRGRQ